MQRDSLVRFSRNSSSLENFVNNSYTEFYENFDTNSLVADTVTDGRTDGQVLHIRRYSFTS